jgi:hypothetical protein
MFQKGWEFLWAYPKNIFWIWKRYFDIQGYDGEVSRNGFIIIILYKFQQFQ